MRLHPLSNGKAYGWGKLRSIFDFFLPVIKYHPYKKGDKKKTQYIRCEAATSVNQDGKIQRDFYTFRAFAIHYFYEFFINPFRYFVKNAEEFALQIGVSPQFAMKIGAIAFDAAGNAVDARPSGGTTLTWAHTCTGSNALLLASAYSNNNDFSGATYNSVAMTELARTGAGFLDSQEIVYGKLTPATGANNIVVTFNAGSYVGGNSASYSGVLQSGLPDSSSLYDNTTGDKASVTQATTVVTANSWLYMGVHATVAGGGASTQSAGAGTTQRGTGSGFHGQFDSNAGVAAGSQSLIVNFSASARAVTITMVSFAPFVVPDLAISVIDSVTVAEDIATTGDLGDINVFDAVTVTEVVMSDSPIEISVFENIAVAESLTVENSNLGDISVFDSITITEIISLTISPARKGLIKMRSTEQSYPLAMDDTRQL